MKSYTPKRKNRNIMHSKELSNIILIGMVAGLILLIINYPVLGY